MILNIHNSDQALKLLPVIATLIYGLDASIGTTTQKLEILDALDVLEAIIQGLEPWLVPGSPWAENADEKLLSKTQEQVAELYYNLEAARTAACRY